MYIITSRSIQKINNINDFIKVKKYMINNKIEHKFTSSNINIDKLLKIKKELSSLAA